MNITSGGIDDRAIGDGLIVSAFSAQGRAQRGQGSKRVIHLGDTEVHRCRADVATVAVVELGGAILSRVIEIETTVDGTRATVINFLTPCQARLICQHRDKRDYSTLGQIQNSWLEFSHRRRAL